MHASSNSTLFVHLLPLLTQRNYHTGTLSMSQNAQLGEQGQFKPVEKPQTQSLPGSEKDLKPTSESTRLEGAEGFVEYQAAGKLKGEKAFITGGE